MNKFRHTSKNICIKKTRCHCVRPDAFRAPNLDQKKSASKKYHSSSCSCSRGSSSSSSSNVSTWLVAWYSIVAKKSSLFSSMLFGGGLYCGKFFSIFIIFCWFMFLIVPNYFFEFIFKWINLKLFLCFSFFEIKAFKCKVCK